jgi:MoaA/NifB/PqqE/SkfB family radical SAM enzyme
MDELSASEAMRMVDQIYEFGASWLGISGGEPFLRDDLFEVVRYAMMVGLNVSLITSGRHFDSKKI